MTRDASGGGDVSPETRTALRPAREKGSRYVIPSPERQSALTLRAAVRRYLRAGKALAETPADDLALEEHRLAAEFLGGATMAFDIHWKVEPERGER